MQLDQNILIVGDSFCASSSGWPSELASALNLKLISHGQGGQSWWNAREFVESLPPTAIESTEVMVFVHTNADRIPTHNIQIGQINYSRTPETEIEKSVQLYYKYIHEPKFLNWAQQQWFLEITQRWPNKKIVHLHSFPWTEQHGHLLSGLNIGPNLCSISLNELGATEFILFDDPRSNHLNEYNNTILAQQLTDLIQNYKKQKIRLNTDLFDLKIKQWFDWS